jgi:hypothetical protein
LVITISFSLGTSNLTFVGIDLLDGLFKMELYLFLLIPGFFVKDELPFLGNSCKKIGKPDSGIVGKV